MRIGSCFSGIGGLELGLEWAGVGQTVWQVERDPFCRQVLAKHWPDAVRHDDVRTVSAHNLEPVDVICGGYPCQPFSLSGYRKGVDDERHLWPEFARIICELRPRYAVLENVAAHLTLGFDAVLGDLAALGYNAEWSVVSACSVGAAHLRERLFVVAHTDSVGLQGRLNQRPRQRVEALAKAPLRRDLSPPLVCRGSDGISNRAHRLRALGNAVVPQVAEVVGRRLLEIDAELRQEAAA